MEDKLNTKLELFKINLLDDIKREISKQLDEKLEQLHFENEQLKHEVEELQKTYKKDIGEVRTQLENIQEINCQLKQQVITNEQYGRRVNVRIFGVTEDKQENCKNLALDIITKELHKKMEPDDIVTAHRITSRISPRPIIVTFKTHDTKMKVIKARRALKGTKITIAEDLCQDLYQLMNRLKQNTDRVKQVWAWDSKVYVQSKKGKIAVAEWGQSLDQILA